SFLDSRAVLTPPTLTRGLSDVRVMSVGVAPPENLDRGARENRKIERKARVPRIPKVEFHAPLHHLGGRGFAAQPVHLRPAGDAGHHMLAQFVIVDQRCKEM